MLNVKWVNAENCILGFETLTSEAPLPCLYNKELPITLDCDASSYRVGEMISHLFTDKFEKPTAYASRRLNSRRLIIPNWIGEVPIGS